MTEIWALFGFATWFQDCVIPQAN